MGNGSRKKHHVAPEEDLAHDADGKHPLEVQVCEGREDDEEQEGTSQTDGDKVRRHGTDKGNLCDEIGNRNCNAGNRVVPFEGDVSVAEKAHDLERENTPLDNERDGPLLHVIAAHGVEVDGPFLEESADFRSYRHMSIGIGVLEKK